MQGENEVPGPGHRDWVYHVAEQLAAAELPPRGEQPGGRSGRPRWLLALIGVAVVGLLAVGIAVLTGGDDDGAIETADPPVTTAVASTLATAPTTVAASTTAAPTTTSAASQGAATSAAADPGPTTTAAEVTTSTAPPSTTVPADPLAPPVRWAEYSDGQVFLRGRVPDQATADEVATRAGQVLGPENVIVEYTIDPTAPKPDSAPLYVNNSILFGPGLALLNAEARATLDLGVSLLALFPEVTFDIEGHTDSVGTEEENLALSTRRVDAIVAYLIGKGVDPTRLTALPKGESEPIADNATPEGQALNRRIEIQVNGFLA